MDKRTFGDRLNVLRTQLPSNVSAREMSQSLGQGDSYINNIENGGNYPSMASFFVICEYLDVTPSEFFDSDSAAPALMREMIENLKKLDAVKLEHLNSIIKEMVK